MNPIHIGPPAPEAQATTHRIECPCGQPLYYQAREPEEACLHIIDCPGCAACLWIPLYRGRPEAVILPAGREPEAMDDAVLTTLAANYRERYADHPEVQAVALRYATEERRWRRGRPWCWLPAWLQWEAFHYVGRSRTLREGQRGIAPYARIQRRSPGRFAGILGRIVS